jgi:hypothetical protein
MSHIKEIAELAGMLVVGLVVGYKYAKSKFAAGISAVVADVKKL